MFDFRATFGTLRPWKRRLSASDSGPTPRRAKSDFLSVSAFFLFLKCIVPSTILNDADAIFLRSLSSSSFGLIPICSNTFGQRLESVSVSFPILDFMMIEIWLEGCL